MSLKSTIVIGAGVMGLISLSGIGSYAIRRFSQSHSLPPAAEVAPVFSKPVSSTQAAAGVSREVLSCTITMAKVDTSQPTVPVYLAANNPSSKVVGYLDNQSFVTVEMEQRGWFLIHQPIEGWIQKKLTQSSCNEKVEMVKFGEKGGVAAIADQFVGSGNHLYRLPLNAGETLTIGNTRGVLPFILNPEGELLAEPKESQLAWSGQVPKTGVYTLEMLSQHKGYRYAFTVSVH